MRRKVLELLIKDSHELVKTSSASLLRQFLESDPESEMNPHHSVQE
ncbi:hypothetical protein DYBT9275_03731 [Dyadobacter sp. CECT 9275]|uniref:Uncharacterized protein n=1 Tax=Dyadobacter helix TaxID=2822344 RepID=A0A916ND56_9BACT|nr:hypothetical protein DYBT9275_03731 [Dyadobacter sp. CECT 9275]